MPGEARETLAGLPAGSGATGSVYNALAVICLAERDPSGALDVLREVPDVTPPTGPAFTLVETQLLAGIAHLALGDRGAAAAAAKAALTIAEPDRLIFPFAMVDARELLNALPRQETTHGALLADIVDLLASESVPIIDRELMLPLEDISPSELRVLRYLPTNLTRPEIATALYLSIHTINAHIRNIYSKLGARDRASAVRRARELRLLSAGRS
jgi:LuxR family maltose regulon positive regulatory protein